MVSLAQANKRRDKDVTKILVSGYEVEITNEKTMNEFIVKNFKGPEDSPYEGVSIFIPPKCLRAVADYLLYASNDLHRIH